MRPTDFQPTAYRYQGSLRSRVVAAALSLGLIVLIVFMLVRMGWMTGPGPGNGGRLVAVTIAPEARKSTDKARAKSAARASAQAPQVQPVIPPPVPVPTDTPPPLNLIKLSTAEFAAADIGKMARKQGAPGAAAGDGDAAQGAGQAPGGGRLYNAEWFREPTNAELAGYFPPGSGAPGEWAMIACRTIDHFHVEDCRELDESPRGSGLARALRQAAWQFLVRPPRIGGKAMVGEWVRIRFDFRHGKAAG